MPPKASKKKVAANGYKLPDPIPEGTIVNGLGKKDQKFRMGKSIGVGGFGEIYLASEDVTRPVKGRKLENKKKSTFVSKTLKNDYLETKKADI